MEIDLSRKHTNVEEFCTLKRFLIDADEKLKEMQDRSNAITELKFIMQENMIKIPQTNETKEKENVTIKKNCEERLSKGNDDIEANDQKYKRMLGKEVPLLEEEVKAFVVKLDNPLLHSDTTSVKVGIEMVEGLRADIERIKERGKTINSQ
jgi:hypothetical protein